MKRQAWRARSESEISRIRKRERYGLKQAAIVFFLVFLLGSAFVKLGYRKDVGGSFRPISWSHFLQRLPPILLISTGLAAFTYLTQVAIGRPVFGSSGTYVCLDCSTANSTSSKCEKCGGNNLIPLEHATLKTYESDGQHGEKERL